MIVLLRDCYNNIHQFEDNKNHYIYENENKQYSRFSEKWSEFCESLNVNATGNTKSPKPTLSSSNKHARFNEFLSHADIDTGLKRVCSRFSLVFTGH